MHRSARVTPTRSTVLVGGALAGGRETGMERGVPWGKYEQHSRG